MSDINLKDRRIALVGGAGFIGHHLALQLKAEGAHVEIIDGLQVNNLLTYSAFNGDKKAGDLYLSIINQRLDLIRQAGIPLHPQDARDYHAFGRILEKIKPQVIVHLAAVAHAGSANKDPYSTFDHSLRTLENSLDCARNHVEQFVFFSSSMAYGNFMTPEVSEDHPLNPMGIYGALKLAGEKMVIAYNQVFNLPYTIVRPSALYGPRCVSRRVGQIFIESAMKNSPLRVDGDGNEKLDFTYIDDLAQGIKLIIQKPQAINQVFNITYGQSRSINELVEIVQKSFENIPVEYVKRDKLMPFRGTLSIKKAQEMLGYKPANPIEVGIPKYIDWYRKLDKDGQFMIDIKVER